MSNLCLMIGCAKPVHGSGYCSAHYRRLRRHGTPSGGNRSPGMGTQASNGYWKRFHRYDHILVAERALGRPLPAGAEVHHVNEIKTDNRGSNLVICPDRAYHMLLHSRARAFDACGHADWKRCQFYRKWDSPEALTGVSTRRSVAWHVTCRNEVRRAKRLLGHT